MPCKSATKAAPNARRRTSPAISPAACEGVGIDPDEVSSPTFTIVQASGGGRIQHVDLYRLESAEVDDLGLEELPDGGALVCIEWADRLPRPVPGAVSVRILDRGGDTRELVIDTPIEIR